MKKVYLPLIISAVVILGIFVAYGQGQKSPGVQAWEYKSITIVRSAQSNSVWSDWVEVTGDIVKTLPLPVSVPKRSKELGEQGWELVSITPISNNAGGFSNSGANDLAGFTSSLMYWFKRPK